MDNDQISMILTYALIGMVVILFIMIIVYISIVVKGKKRKKLEEKDDNEDDLNAKSTDSEVQSTSQSKYGKVLDFMQFENIEDNMIIIKEKKKYVMVIECQGVNYDLMSGMEKTGVEEGFLQFLNTLRYPIQLYIQTRSINLEKSIEQYKKSLNEFELKYNRNKIEYEELRKAPGTSSQQLQRAFFEMTKSQNLYEYGKDIIRDTERMSLNKNILNKKYYVIIPYYYENLNNEVVYDKEEIRNMAFLDLYTKAQAVVRSLAPTGVTGKVLDSIGLVELLYMAYNRDGAEVYGIERALKASYDKLYSTSQDIFEKRLQEIDKEIERSAVEKAKQQLQIAKSKKEREIEKKEKEKDKLINDLAKIILESNKKYVGKELTNMAIDNLEQETTDKKGGE